MNEQTRKQFREFQDKARVKLRATRDELTAQGYLREDGRSLTDKGMQAISILCGGLTILCGGF